MTQRSSICNHKATYYQRSLSLHALSHPWPTVWSADRPSNDTTMRESMPASQPSPTLVSLDRPPKPRAEICWQQASHISPTVLREKRALNQTNESDLICDSQARPIDHSFAASPSDGVNVGPCQKIIFNRLKMQHSRHDQELSPQGGKTVRLDHLVCER